MVPLSDLPLVAFILLGLVMLFSGAYWILEALVPFQWRKAEGKIVLSEMSSYEDANISENCEIVTMYQVRIEYTYQIDGRQYRNHRISRSFIGMTLATSERRDFQSYIKRYPKGASVDVFVDPHNPHQALLERFAMEPMIMFVFLFIGGMIILALMIFNSTIAFP